MDILFNQVANKTTKTNQTQKIQTNQQHSTGR